MTTSRLFYFFIISLIFCGLTTNDYQDDAKVLQKITNPQTYSKFLRPHHKGYPVNVTVRMIVVHIVSVREVEEEFSLDIEIVQQWTDPRLNHSLQFPITLASSDSKNLIWLPDTYFLNIRSAAIHDVTSENTKVKIRRGGFVTYSIRLTVTAGCAMDLSDYPLDELHCDLKISTYAYDTDNLNFKWSNGPKADKVRVEDDELSQFTLLHTDALQDFQQYSDGPHSKLVALFWFRRRLGYAFIQVYFPTIMLVVLSWLLFWIPQESIPARASLGSTTVLSIVTFTGSFRNTFPKVSYVKAVDVYFIVSFAFIFAALMEYILLLLNNGFERKSRIGSESNSQHHNNDVLQDKQQEVPQELEEIIVAKPTSNHAKITATSMTASVKKVKEYVHYAFIENEASKIDRVCRYLFPCCYLIFNIFYWCYYQLIPFGAHPPSYA
ncbi:glycine receptor subunit alpha-2-like isoform X1 [Acropora palmata]|uniref:glycine receptor subunit alpha-2-like isoform X1 n=1 Tax=Acropora palmata TaxID=6131 RepID=UPI003DA1BAD4